MDEPLIVKDPDIMSGTPVFYRTRVPVQTLVDYLAGNQTIETFMLDFPTVRREQVERFLEHGAELVIARAVSG